MSRLVAPREQPILRRAREVSPEAGATSKAIPSAPSMASSIFSTPPITGTGRCVSSRRGGSSSERKAPQGFRPSSGRRLMVAITAETDLYEPITNAGCVKAPLLLALTKY